MRCSSRSRLIELPDLSRFWLPDSAELSLSADGFIPDPASSIMSGWIPDARAFVDIEGTPWLVLIGEPGLGKSTALAHEVERVAAAGGATLVVDLSSTADELACVS